MRICIYAYILTKYLSAELLFNTLGTAVALNHHQCHNAQARLPTSQQYCNNKRQLVVKIWREIGYKVDWPYDDPIDPWNKRRQISTKCNDRIVHHLRVPAPMGTPHSGYFRWFPSNILHRPQIRNSVGVGTRVISYVIPLFTEARLQGK